MFFSVPEDYKINPGAVDAMAIQPGNPDNLLIGYERGLMVLWNMRKPAAEQVGSINVFRFYQKIMKYPNF